MPKRRVASGEERAERVSRNSADIDADACCSAEEDAMTGTPGINLSEDSLGVVSVWMNIDRVHLGAAVAATVFPGRGSIARDGESLCICRAFCDTVNTMGLLAEDRRAFDNMAGLVVVVSKQVRQPVETTSIIQHRSEKAEQVP